MENSGSQRNGLLGILLTWCAYIGFALLTDWENFGLEPHWQVSRQHPRGTHEFSYRKLLYRSESQLELFRA